MPRSLFEKAAQFRALHQQPGAFLIPNPWDTSSARLLAGLGFSCLATSSAAAAATLGRRDGQITRDQALDHAQHIADATDLPVAGDLENGFADEPAEIFETIRLAASVGLVGGSIEDATRDKLYPRELAVERIAAAVAAARALPFPFILTARCENFIRGNPNLDDTIERLQAYARAGADVVFAPGLPSLEAVRQVCAAVDRPLNFMAAIPGKSFSVGELQAAGVKRISFAATLYRAAMTGLLDAAREIKDHGTFTYLDRSVTAQQLNGLAGL